MACSDCNKCAFMYSKIKVKKRCSGWEKTVKKVLSGIKGVTNFAMDDEGIVQVSGMVDPQLLLKRLGEAGKRAELCWFQFGECSSNLYPPPPPPPSRSRSSASDESTGNISVGYGTPQNDVAVPANYYGRDGYGGYGGQGYYSGPAGYYGPANYYGNYGYNGYGGQGCYGERRPHRPFGPLAQSIWRRNAPFEAAKTPPSAPLREWRQPVVMTASEDIV